MPDVFHFAGLADKPLLIEDAFDPSIAHLDSALVPRRHAGREVDPAGAGAHAQPLHRADLWRLGATRCAWELGEPELNAVDELMREIAAGVLRAAPQRAEP